MGSLTESKLYTIMKNSDIQSFMEVINKSDCNDNVDLRNLSNPEFLDFLKIYIDAKDLSNSGFELLVNLIFMNNLKGIDLLLEKYPDLPMFSESDDWKLEKNIMNCIMWSSNYVLYLKFVSLYPNLMNSMHGGKYPIQCLNYCDSWVSNSIYDWARPSKKNIELREKIFKHHIENSQSTSPLQYTIPRQLQKYTNDYLMFILNKFQDDPDLLTEILRNNLPSHHISYNTVAAYLDAGIDYTCYNYTILKNLCRNLEFLTLFVTHGYEPDANTLSYACSCENYEMFKHVYYNYNIDIDKLDCDIPILHHALNFSVNEFLEIIDYPNIDIFVKCGDDNILQYIFSNEIYLNNRSKIIEKLIEKGLNPYERDEIGLCFFHYGLSYDEIKTLHKLGIDLVTQPEDPDDQSVLGILDSATELNEEEYIEIANLLFSEYVFSEDNIDVLLESLSYVAERASSQYNRVQIESWKRKMRFLQKFIPLSDSILEFIDESQDETIDESQDETTDESQDETIDESQDETIDE